MAFSDCTMEVEWKIADGKCEKCRKSLSWRQRGRTGSLAWEARHKDGNPENNGIMNCQILCWDCHGRTL